MTKLAWGKAIKHSFPLFSVFLIPTSTTLCLKYLRYSVTILYLQYLQHLHYYTLRTLLTILRFSYYTRTTLNTIRYFNDVQYKLIQMSLLNIWKRHNHQLFLIFANLLFLPFFSSFKRCNTCFIKQLAQTVDITELLQSKVNNLG